MVALTAVKPGDKLWERQRVKEGNTTLTRIVHYPVSVVEVHDGYILAHWNGNAELTRMGQKTLNRCFRKKPTKA